MTVSKTDTARTLCIDECVAALEAVDAEVSAFIAELGRAQKPLPDKFRMDDERWEGARGAMEEAASRDDVAGCVDACIEYRKRAAKYLDGWRVKLGLKQEQRRAA